MNTDSSTSESTAPISDETRRQILDLLSAIEAEHNLRVLFACESGSRAWGFASNDSDFDVRFIFARPASDYLRLRPSKDAFDVMAPGDLDAAGWDIRKTAELMRRSNPPLMEWIDSPIVYRAEPGILDRLRQLRAMYFDAKKAAFHYLSMARTVWDTCLCHQERPVRKKYLYALRPLACISFIEAHLKQPPTQFEAVLEAVNWPADVMRQVRQLVADKKENLELGAGEADATLNQHIVNSLAAGEQIAAALQPNDQSTDALDQLICDLVLPN